MVGETKDAGFEIGVSQTIPFPIAQVWEFLVSDAGVALWLGKGARLATEKGTPYATEDGTAGEIRSYHPSRTGSG
ncbi:hypothetical protein [Fodinicola feengrottensis]|uniref:hypothetical protein n=1 Tax=Fodinicola feengrottensis TaxID=435914 RepID=UPI002442B3F1|nr:hypothetical protein [Fodinicola feengrottensis]